MSFEEIQHTADCAIRVTAADLASLFAEAARGMNSIAGVKIRRGPRVGREIRVRASDNESLLVAFLTEIVYALEHEGVGFDRFRLRISGGEVAGRIDGAPLASLSKPIKAVTFHNLAIRKTPSGLGTEIVFDV
jgi:SHS2 domain-containing protein